jgi:PBP1b-binding outer membrane lipoprotein LpoB
MLEFGLRRIENRIGFRIIMKKTVLLSSLLLLLIGCSQKIKTIDSKCQKIEQEMLDLEQEKRLNWTSKVANTVVNGYPYGTNSKMIEQRIKVLRMKLDGCKRER